MLKRARDLDFGRMIAAFRSTAPEVRKHDAPGDHDICCVVRKRPINSRELKLKDWDSVTCMNPRVVVHAPKLKVDGITKYLDNMTFSSIMVRRPMAFSTEGVAIICFACRFLMTLNHPRLSTITQQCRERLYTRSHSRKDTTLRLPFRSLVAYMFQKKGHGTVFAYGQTGRFVEAADRCPAATGDASRLLPLQRKDVHHEQHHRVRGARRAFARSRAESSAAARATRCTCRSLRSTGPAARTLHDRNKVRVSCVCGRPSLRSLGWARSLRCRGLQVLIREDAKQRRRRQRPRLGRVRRRCGVPGRH